MIYGNLLNEYSSKINYLLISLNDWRQEKFSTISSLTPIYIKSDNSTNDIIRVVRNTLYSLEYEQMVKKYTEDEKNYQ